MIMRENEEKKLSNDEVLKKIKGQEVLLDR